MKMQRVKFPVMAGGQHVDDVTAVLRIPRKFLAGHTPAVLLAHGAGGGVDDPALIFVQAYLVGRGFLTLGFNFPYREHERKAPDRDNVLEATIHSALDYIHRHANYSPGPIFIGGKSMGGRMASHLAAVDRDIATGLILLAYPLHAPGRPDRVRDKHLPDIALPTLFVSGTRDALAPSDSLRIAVKKVAQAQIVWIEGADHSFNMLRKSGVSAEDVWHQMAEAVANWLDGILAARAGRPNPSLAPPQAPAVSTDASRSGEPRRSG